MLAGSATAQTDPPAGVVRRLAASTYEGLLLAALAVVVSLALLPWVGPGTSGASQTLSLPGPGARAITFACLFLVAGAYCTWLWSGGRRTLPMRTWGIALLTAAGATVTPARAAVRYLASWVAPTCAIAAYLALRPHGHRRWAVACLAVNYAWALVDRDRRFLQDRLAGTRLIRAPARRTPDG